MVTVICYWQIKGQIKGHTMRPRIVCPFALLQRENRDGWKHDHPPAQTGEDATSPLPSVDCLTLLSGVGMAALVNLLLLTVQLETVS